MPFFGCRDGPNPTASLGLCTRAPTREPEDGAPVSGGPRGAEHPPGQTAMFNIESAGLDTASRSVSAPTRYGLPISSPFSDPSGRAVHPLRTTVTFTRR